MPWLAAEELGNGNPQANTGYEENQGGAKSAGDVTMSQPCSRRERLLELFELCLVVLVAFGVSSLYSVFSLFEEGEYFWTTRNVYSWLRFLVHWTAVLALLVYVLWGRGASRPLPAAGLSLTLGRKVRLLRRISLPGLCLVLLVAFWQPALDLALSQAAQSSFLRGVIGDSSQLDNMLMHAVSLIVLGYVLHQRGQSFSTLGLHWSSRTAVLALPLFLLGLFLQKVEWPSILWAGQTFGQPGWTPPDLAWLFGQGTELTTIPHQLLNGFGEELIVRAWIMTEVARLTRSTWVAVVVSVSVQISYHFYQGVPAALSHIFLFTLYALFYARTRLILPVALAHALQDLGAEWLHGLRAISTQ
jgi:membrane protease YdiL (CAAX protease family)